MSVNSVSERDKPQLLQLIIDKLVIDLDIAQRAAQTAYEAATAEENIAENKYDTLGLEASYLATGQARRMEEIRQSLVHYQNLILRDYDETQGIEVSALVTLLAENGQHQYLFLGPDAAGLKIQLGSDLITVITSRSPLGQGLLGKFEGDEVQITVAGVVQHHEIVEVL
ncbi:GreA/GreB family elongation factor [Pseudomonas sp. R5(2019)]|uniref:GreA/GreB family elongation factor n=1 Tax=Pseudomonas sp. R5(2019) TaxID=2697566 RepID=UPI0014125652|nr:GreA/GreB family elongation factor [Pseudomonas sp. R5(2019)]NBA93910.1 transcription elongation factor GreAB [Pseudomonas sp. R5(2019)]